MSFPEDFDVCRKPLTINDEGTGWIPTRSATPSTALVPQRKVGFPIPNAGLLLGFQGTKTARRGGISSPFSDAGGCTSPQNSGLLVDVSNARDRRTQEIDCGAGAHAALEQS